MSRSFTITVRKGWLGAGAALAVLAGAGLQPFGAIHPARAATMGNTLTVAIPSPPASLDPAKDGNGPYIATQMVAYDSLLYYTPQGKFVPRLATSWGYVGKGNKTFDVTLRKGAQFSDGSPVNAAAVKASIDYFKAAKGPLVSYAASIASVQMMGPYKVRFHLSSPNPIMPTLLAQNQQVGNIISPKAIAKSASLATSTDGAGPYMLDRSQTVSADHYTYVPNPHYWNKGQIHYHKIVLKVIATPSSTLQAMESGQVDFANGDTTTGAAAKSAGLKVQSFPTGFIALFLVDRGTVVPALANAKVRQALNYAIDRATIAKALMGGFGKPTSEFPTLDAWDKKMANAYPYDPAKAKQLLAQAGYAKGFTIPVLDLAGSSPTNDGITQAIVPYLTKVGVKLQVKTEPTLTPLINDLQSKKYAGLTFAWGSQLTWLFVQQVLAPGAGLDATNFDDKTLDALWKKGAASSNPEAYWKKIVNRITAQAEGVPVTTLEGIVYSRSTVKNVQVSSHTFAVDVRNIEPA